MEMHGHLLQKTARSSTDEGSLLETLSAKPDEGLLPPRGALRHDSIGGSFGILRHGRTLTTRSNVSSPRLPFPTSGERGSSTTSMYSKRTSEPVVGTGELDSRSGTGRLRGVHRIFRNRRTNLEFLLQREPMRWGVRSSDNANRTSGSIALNHRHNRYYSIRRPLRMPRRPGQYLQVQVQR